MHLRCFFVAALLLLWLLLLLLLRTKFRVKFFCIQKKSLRILPVVCWLLPFHVGSVVVVSVVMLLIAVSWFGHCLSCCSAAADSCLSGCCCCCCWVCVQVLAGYAFSFLILCWQTLNVVDVAIVDVAIVIDVVVVVDIVFVMSLLPLMYKPYVHSEDGKPCIFVASSLLAVAPHQVPSEILLHPKEKFTNPPCALLSRHSRLVRSSSLLLLCCWTPVCVQVLACYAFPFLILC